MHKILITSILTTTILMAGCYYDSEEELYPTLECQTEGVTYSGTVLPLIQTNCYVCHSQAAQNGNVVLEGYSNLKIYVENGRFLGAISHDAGFSPMPKNSPQLVECNIEKLVAWVAAGALDN